MNIIKRIAQILKPIEQPEPAERALMFDQVAQQLMQRQLNDSLNNEDWGYDGDHG